MKTMVIKPNGECEEHEPECSCPRKPANAKGKQHRVCCFHDEPGITVCTCDAGRGDPGLDAFLGEDAVLTWERDGGGGGLLTCPSENGRNEDSR